MQKYKYIRHMVRGANASAVRWWQKLDARYGWRWRVASAMGAVLIVSSVILPVLQYALERDAYALHDTTRELTGRTDTKLTKLLTYDATEAKYQFNRDAIKPAGGPPELQKRSIGAPADKASVTYALDVPADMSQGVTYHDTNSRVSFGLVPQFKAKPGKLVDGHLVYPMADGMQAVYTLKNNGLKEDIIVPKVQDDTMSFTYDIKLPKSLQMKAIPDGGGAVGIYSADPMLFGDISYGSDEDRAKVEKARENAEKTYLVFGIPAPIIKAANGKSIGDATARFVLTDTTLTVVAEKLEGIDAPITIDPSVVVTSTSDFGMAGNDEGMIDFATSGEVKRGGLTGGSIGSWTAGTTMNETRWKHATVVYNGYIYALGGDNNTTFVNTVEYAQIQSDGTLGAWTPTTSFATARDALGAVAYNGYIYIIGGHAHGTGYNGSDSFRNVQYAKLSSTGAVGTWANTTELPDANDGINAVVYNGYVYVTGGSSYDLNNASARTYYAPLKADGTIGAWALTSTMNTARAGHGGFVHNGYIYAVGGISLNFTTWVNTVEFAPINADGTLGAWVLTSSFANARSGHATAVLNGYVYIIGGNNNSAPKLDAQYAPILANGTLGAWVTTSSLPVERDGVSAIANGNRIYILSGGFGGGDGTTLRTVVATAGTATPFTNGTTFAANRRNAATVVTLGYIYVLGGEIGGAPVATVYGAPINNDGSIGTWAAKTSFTTARHSLGAFAYEGYIYVLGGCTTQWSSCTTSGAFNATVYGATVNSAGTIGAWASKTNLSGGRYGHFAGAHNGYAYVMGGITGTGGTFLNTIHYATINASGTIGAWTAIPSGITLPANMAYFGAAINGGRIYVTGGCTAGITTCTAVSNNIHYATIGANGDLSGSFTSSGTFTNARGAHGMAIINGYVYITGGRSSTTYYGDTQFAPIGSTGAVGSWTTSAASTLLTNRYGIGTAAHNGRIYVTGGYNGTTYYNNVQYARVNNGGGGAAGTFSAANTTNLPGLDSVGNATIVYKGYIYVLGGVDAYGGYVSTSNVYYTKINGDGSLANWGTTTSLPGARTTSASIYNGRMYAFGGNDWTAALDDIDSAPINADGTLGAWSTAGTLSTATEDCNAYFYNGRVYVTVNTSDLHVATQYATVNATTGAIGSWTNGPDVQGVSHYGAAGVQNGKYIYLIAPYNYGTGSGMTTVEYTSINPDGTMNPWQFTTPISGYRYSAEATIANGFIYLSGGLSDWTKAIRYQDVQYAPLLPDGGVGNWTSTATLANELYGHGFVSNNGYLYTVGGQSYNNGGSYEEFLGPSTASIEVMERKARYSKLVDLGTAVNVSGITYNGNIPTGSAALSYRAAGADGVFSNSLSASSLATVSPCTTTQASTRYMLVTVALDDTATSVFTDTDSTKANLTDFTVSYLRGHPDPNIRLKAGKTLLEGEGQSPLDTCYETSQTVASDTFTGANGSAWSSTIWSAAGQTPATGGSTIQNNEGQLRTGATGGYSGGDTIRRPFNTPARRDGEIVTTFRFDANESFLYFMLRADADLHGSNGYDLRLIKGESSHPVGSLVSASRTEIGYVNPGFTLTDGVNYKIRYSIDGSVIRAKIWIAANAEPTDWQLTLNNTAVTAPGYFGISLAGGGAASSSYLWIDDTYLYDPVY